MLETVCLSSCHSNCTFYAPVENTNDCSSSRTNTWYISDFTSRDSRGASIPGVDLDDDVTSHGNRLILLERNNRGEIGTSFQKGKSSLTIYRWNFYSGTCRFNGETDEMIIQKSLTSKLIVAYSSSSDSIVL